MTYKEALIYIESLEKQGHTPDHKNSVTLMAYLGNPQDKMPVVHVAGTNGKGSTIAFIESMLLAGGYKVGRFTSPHILSPRELTHINKAPISEEALAGAMTKVQEACHQMLTEGHKQPTVFECLTAASLVHLSEADLDLAIVEVGLGGRYDSTNVFQAPLLTVITQIAYDHTAILGNTLSEIAWHKGGIIKAKVPTIIAPNPFEVIEAISAIVHDTGGQLFLMDEGFIHEEILMTTGYTKLFHLSSNFFQYKGLRTSMLGRHQTLNLCTALLAIYQLRKLLPLSQAQIKKGIAQTHWHCRNDLISKNPLIMVDGGHNTNAVQAMSELIKRHFPDHKVITVLGLLTDKDCPSIQASVMAFSHRVIATRPLSPRAMSPDAFTPQEGLIIEDDYKEALKKALSLYHDKTLLLVFGSLYLAYPAKEWLLNHLEASDQVDP